MARAKSELPEVAIKFLGTAGARFVVARQLRSSAGTWIKIGLTEIMLDPGPGTLVRCWSARPKLDPSRLEAVVLTHHHLDHANDVNVIVEAMTDGGHRRRGMLLAPAEAYEGDSPLCRYVTEFPAVADRLVEGGQWEVGQGRVRVACRMKHGVETYGLIFDCGGLQVGFVADTYYFDGLGEAFAGCDVLVLNVVLFEDRGPDVMHLNPSSAARVIEAVKPRLAVITHFGMNMLRNKPWLIAQDMSERLGVEVRAASDGMLLDLTELGAAVASSG